MLHQCFPVTIGGDEINFLNGYLSDSYYVGDQVLLPTVFGAEYFGAWGPLNSTVVKANIDAAQVTAVGGAVNRNVDWVNQLSASGGFLTTSPANNAFNGSTANSAVSANLNDPIEFNTTAFPSSGGPYSVVIYADNKQTPTVDGAAMTPDAGTGTVAFRLSGTVASVSNIT